MGTLPRVKVVNPNDDWLGTEYYIDGQKIERVKSVDFRVAVDEVPTFTFETIGAPDIDMSGDIQFSFTPQTVDEARKIIEHETKNKHRVDLGLHHNGLMARIDGEYVPAFERIDPDNEESAEKMKFIPNENILFSKDIQVDLSQYVRFSVIVLRNELWNHGVLYDGFLASIKSALNECPADEDNDFKAKAVLRRIIGEE